MRQTRPAARFEKTPSAIRHHAPTLGQHTDEVLAEVGFTGPEIPPLRTPEVVA